MDGGQLQNQICVHAELQQQLPRRIRPQVNARGIYYLVGGTLVSVAIAALIIIVGSLTPKEIKDRVALKREGSLTYTNDVRVGGGRSSTVFYTFTFKGQSYSGKAFLPHEYLDKVVSYSKVGNFPILFVPRNPSINHPYDWMGSGSFPLICYLLTIIIIVQWSVLIKSIFQDLRFARNGATAIARVTKCSYGRNGGIYLKYEFFATWTASLLKEVVSPRSDRSKMRKYAYSICLRSPRRAVHIP